MPKAKPKKATRKPKARDQGEQIVPPLNPPPAEIVVSPWPTNRLKPYGKNPREIPERAIKKVARSILKFGWRQPIVVDEHDVIIIGHARLLAAKSLGLNEVPVHVAKGLSDATVRALRLADNKTGSESSWNYELLRQELGELKLDGELDLEDTAFDMGEIDALLNQMTNTLGDAENRFGAGDDADFWPSIDIKVPQKTKARFDNLMELLGDGEDHSKFLKVVKAAELEFATNPPKVKKKKADDDSE